MPTLKKQIWMAWITAFSLLCATAPMALAAKPSNKQLTIGITQEFDTMNPMLSTMIASHYLYFFVGHPIVSLNMDWQQHCWLCTRIPTFENGQLEIITENGRKKLLARWELQPGVRWGDGIPFTGHDVRFSWEVGRSPNVRVGDKDIYESIEDVIVDPQNPKKFTLKWKEVRFDHYQLGTFYIVPKHLENPVWQRTKDKLGGYEKQSVYTTDPTNPGLYFGPYVVKEIKYGSHAVFERNPKFFGKPAKIKKVMFKIVPNTQTLEANLLSGTIDMVSELGMKMDQMLGFEKRVAKDPQLRKRFRVVYRPGLIYEHIDLNLRHPFLQDVNVRRALVYAIDRDKLVQALFEGKQKKAIANVPPMDPYYTEDVVKYPYDPKKAAQLLERAGWKLGKDGIRRKDGKKLLFTLMTTAQDKSREQVQLFLQHEWKKVGIETRIKNEPGRVFFGETVKKAKYPHMAMYAFIQSPDAPPFSTLLSSSIPTAENGYSGQNRPGYVNTKVDTALETIKTEFDLEKRKQLMQVVLYEYTKDVPVIPLYMRSENAIVPKNMRNFRLSGHQFLSSLEANKWDLN